MANIKSIIVPPIELYLKPPIFSFTLYVFTRMYRIDIPANKNIIPIITYSKSNFSSKLY